MKDLFETPESFNFFQAVRLLELAALTENRSGPVGTNTPPEHEAVRFRSRPTLGFATSDVQSIEQIDGANVAEMKVNFMGFVGTAGILPLHYTESVIARLQLRDTTLRDFLDVFQHRSISLFYRAWSKYRFPFAFEQHAHQESSTDRFTSAVLSLVGLGVNSHQGRQSLADSALAHSSGHFSKKVRSAAGLKGCLEDLLGVPVRILEFQGRWLTIPDHERCLLPLAGEPGTHTVQLGRGATLGARVWEIQSKVTIELGPVSKSQFEQIRPGGPGHESLCDLARTYLGLSIDFDLRIHQAKTHPTGISIGGSPLDKPQLGRNTWLASSPNGGRPRTAHFPCGHR